MEKKILLAFLLSFFLIGFVNAIDIGNCTDLQAMENDLTADYVLTNNIDCSDTINWNGGSGFDPVATAPLLFTGNFDGQGYNITDLFINSSNSNLALFESVGAGVTLENVNILNAHIEQQLSSTCGILAGTIDTTLGGTTTIRNVSTSGIVMSAQQDCGGLIGDVLIGDVIITNSHSSASISCVTLDCGGLIGYIENSEITNSYATGDVTGDNYVGGLVGYSVNTQITNSYATGDITGITINSIDLGGLVGLVDGGGTITNSYATGDVTGDDFSSQDFGGLVGGIIDGTITNSYATGDVTSAFAGGLVGTFYDTGTFIAIDNCSSSGNVYGGTGGYTGGFVSATGTYSGGMMIINNSHSSGNVTGDSSGGFIGIADNGTYISNSYATGNVNGFTDVGGFGGFVSLASISNSYATGNVNGSYDIGGLVGYNYQSTITNSYATANVNGLLYCGGLSAQVDGGVVANSYATGNINCLQYAGGLVGFLTNSGTINNSYSSGSVNGSSDIGGLVGYSEYAFLGVITNSYSVGMVTGDTNVGGLVGFTDVENTSVNSFWDTETSSQETSAEGEGKTTIEMQTESTFTDASWDFVNIWQMNPTLLYPDLINNPLVVEESPSEEITNKFPNKITGSGTIYEVMDSSGAGLGKLFDYMKVALPILLIGLAIVGIVLIVAFAIANQIKEQISRREV